MSLHKLNGTSAGTADIKQVLSSVGTFSAQNGVLFVSRRDPVFQQKQQQSLLECWRTGR